MPPCRSLNLLKSDMKQQKPAGPHVAMRNIPVSCDVLIRFTLSSVEGTRGSGPAGRVGGSVTKVQGSGTSNRFLLVLLQKVQTKHQQLLFVQRSAAELQINLQLLLSVARS